VERSDLGAPIAVAVVIGSLLLAACGDDDGATTAGDATDPTETATEVSETDAPETVPSVTEVPETDAPETPSTPTYQHPTGGEEVVVQYSELLGFPVFLRSFQAAPTVLISGAGEYISAAPVAAVYPAPLLPAFETRSISEEGVQTVLAVADEANLLREVEYPPDPQIADANTTEVILAADGSRYEHDAYALSLRGDDLGESPFTPQEQADRDALAEFAGQLVDIESLVGPDALGEPVVYEPDAYVMAVVPAAELGGEPAGPDTEVVPWPADTGIVLADIDGCTEAPADTVGELFDDATELTFFDEAGVVYRVAPVQKLPGRTC
jgi:hypothetical protein